MVMIILTHSVTVFLPQLTVRFYNKRWGNTDSSNSSQVQTLENLWSQGAIMHNACCNNSYYRCNQIPGTQATRMTKFFTVAPDIFIIIIAVFPIHTKMCISTHASNHCKDHGSFQNCGPSVWTSCMQLFWHQEFGSDNQIFR